MKILAALSLCALLGGCKQQDAAALVTITGAFRIPADADMLSMDVYDGPLAITHKDWCVTTSASCPEALPLQPGGLDQTITLVEGGGDHPHVKINLALQKTGVLVGQGTNTADFQSGTTVNVPIVMTR